MTITGSFTQFAKNYHDQNGTIDPSRPISMEVALDCLFSKIPDDDCVRKIQDELLFAEMRKNKRFLTHAPNHWATHAIGVGNQAEWWEKPWLKFTPVWWDNGVEPRTRQQCAVASRGKLYNLHCSEYNGRYNSCWMNSVEFGLYAKVLENGIMRFNLNWEASNTDDDGWKGWNEYHWGNKMCYLVNWGCAEDFVRQLRTPWNLAKCWGITDEDLVFIKKKYPMPRFRATDTMEWLNHKDAVNYQSFSK